MLNRQRELTLSHPTVAPTATRSTYFNTAFSVAQACSAGTALRSCDPRGAFATPESYKDQAATSPHSLPTAHVCSSLTQTPCTHADNVAAGCAWGSGACSNALGISKSMDVVCAGTGANAGSCANYDGCVWANSACRSQDLGFDCNSYVTFTSTTWKTWQTVKAIAVDDDQDETLTKPHGPSSAPSTP